MDNRVTKRRVAIHFEYDWIKYIAIIIASVFVCYITFSAINATREYERIEVFITSYSQNEYSANENFLTTIKAEGDDYIREVNIHCYSTLNPEYTTLFQGHGPSCDILIIPKNMMDSSAGAYKWLTDEMLADIFTPEEGEEFNVDVSALDYYEYDASVVPNGKGEPLANGRKYGIRVDNLKKMNTNNPPYEFNYARLDDKYNPDNEEKPLDTEFYLVINPKSIKIGEYGKKSEYHHLTQTFRFIRWFLNEYAV